MKHTSIVTTAAAASALWLPFAALAQEAPPHTVLEITRHQLPGDKAGPEGRMRVIPQADGAPARVTWAYKDSTTDEGMAITSSDGSVIATVSGATPYALALYRRDPTGKTATARWCVWGQAETPVQTYTLTRGASDYTFNITGGGSMVMEKQESGGFKITWKLATGTYEGIGVADGDWMAAVSIAPGGSASVGLFVPEKDRGRGQLMTSGIDGVARQELAASSATPHWPTVPAGPTETPETASPAETAEKAPTPEMKDTPAAAAKAPTPAAEPAAEPAPPTGQPTPMVPATPEDLAEVKKIAADIRANKDALLALRPGLAYLAAVADGPKNAVALSTLVDAWYDTLPEPGLSVPAEQTEVTVLHNFQLHAGYKNLGGFVKPTVKFYGIRYSAPGQKEGTVLDGLVKTDGGWFLIPSAWKDVTAKSP
jgi:hypothetical protein